MQRESLKLTSKKKNLVGTAKWMLSLQWSIEEEQISLTQAKWGKKTRSKLKEDQWQPDKESNPRIRTTPDKNMWTCPAEVEKTLNKARMERLSQDSPLRWAETKLELQEAIKLSADSPG